MAQLESPEFRSIAALIESTTSHLRTEHMVCAPPEKWSIANILEHLALSFAVTARTARIVEGKKHLPLLPVTFRQRLMAWVIIDFGFYPSALIAPKMVTPKGIPPHSAQSLLAESLGEMDHWLTQCAKKLGAGLPLMPHPVLGPLTIRQWRKFHLVHVRHHIKQVKQLLRMAGSDFQPGKLREP